MKTKASGAKYSAIVGIGEQLKRMSEETGQEYLYLNRGVNAVVNIDLSEVIPLIDFNSNLVQVYPANQGILSLRKAIVEDYFAGKVSPDDIFITNGGMNALSLTTNVLDVSRYFVSKFYWGAYTNIMEINKVPYAFYDNFEWLLDNLDQLRGTGVFICDPNNPVGNKFDDEQLLSLVKTLSDNGAVVIWDSPYRRLYYDENDTFYHRMIENKNLVITESFSKSVGLSGQRTGFVYCSDPAFRQEFNIQLLFNTNGINAFGQVLVEKLLTTPQGKKACQEFREKTVADITHNIEYLQRRGLLAQEFYQDSTPVGIFVIVNKNYEQLLEKHIGSVSMPYFTKVDKASFDGYARICVSVPRADFERFFDQL